MLDAAARVDMQAEVESGGRARMAIAGLVGLVAIGAIVWVAKQDTPTTLAPSASPPPAASPHVVNSAPASAAPALTQAATASASTVKSPPSAKPAVPVVKPPSGPWPIRTTRPPVNPKERDVGY